MTIRAALLLVLCLCRPLTAEAEEFQKGREEELRAIQVASQEFERQNRRDVAGYRIRVEQSGESVLVHFGDPNPDLKCLGSCGEKPGFTVELRKGDLALIRSYGWR